MASLSLLERGILWMHRAIGLPDQDQQGADHKALKLAHRDTGTTEVHILPLALTVVTPVEKQGV